jgi:FkbM family methyltransferase
MSIDRKRFLETTGWAAAGAALGALGRGLLPRSPAGEGGSSPPPGAPIVRQSPALPTIPSPSDQVHGDESFSQAGEDLIVRFFFQVRGIGKITYLDIGANDPIELSNTYYFYRRGYRGVLVEPNVSLCEKLRAVRPEDTTLVAGIGATSAKEADYYIMSQPGLNTFSKEEADHQTEVTKGRFSVKEVIKMPLLNINDVMIKYFRDAPTFLSVDTEGLDLEILKSINYERFRPNVICAETLVSSTSKMIPEIPEFMASRGYVARGGSFVNTVFVDSKIL